jgi:cation diffusion facilitator family transporter
MVNAARSTTADARLQERAITFALVLDSSLLVAYSAAAIAAASLTMFAEVVRGVLMVAIEVFALVVMRRIHRGRTAAFEFGSGKVEQLVNLCIAGGLLGGALWIGVGAVQRMFAEEGAGTPAAFAVGAVLASVNLYENVLAWDAMRRAARGSPSLIMKGQLQARVAKLVSSACVQVSLTVAALSPDPVVIVWADSLGALLVSGFIVHTALGMLRAGLPDLLDRSVNEEFQAAINRMLIRHFDDYERLDLVRTRRTGAVVHAEITLGFRPDLTIAEVSRRIEAMKASLRQDVGDADIAILAGQ